MGEIREPSPLLPLDLVSELISFNVNIVPKINYFFKWKFMLTFQDTCAGVASKKTKSKYCTEEASTYKGYRVNVKSINTLVNYVVLNGQYRGEPDSFSVEPVGLDEVV